VLSLVPWVTYRLAVGQHAAHDLPPWWSASFDLVFTAGVLIHVPPAEIDEVLRGMARVSRRWLLSVEYEADVETMINYRGQDDLLWKRPYGAMLAKYGAVRGSGLLTKADGFDNCTWTLVEKLS